MESKQKAYIVVLVVSLCAAPLAAQDATVVWNRLVEPTFDAEKSAKVNEVTLVRDRLRITLTDGVIQFVQPLEGVVFVAAFKGNGRLQVAPPNTLEAQQLRLFTKKDSLDMLFTEAAFSFADGAFEELAGQVEWTTSGRAQLAGLYRKRQKKREDAGAELLPRLLKSILSADRKRTALFFADLKTKEKGWIHVGFDALDPEEITVGRWTDREHGKGFDTWLSFPASDRSASEAFRDPLEKEDFQVASYSINATVTRGAELRATTQVTLSHRAAGERVLVFLLDSNLRVEFVKDSHGADLPFFQPRKPKSRDRSYGDYVAVVLPEATRAGQSQTLEFRYVGKHVIRKVGDGNYFCKSFGWYPTRPNSFASRADFEMTFRSPKRHKLVATGNKVSETTDGKTTISVWKSDLPLAVAGFAFGDYKVFTEKVGSVEVEIYANKHPDDAMRRLQMGDDPDLPTTGIGREALAPSALGNLSPSRLAKTMGAEVANTLRLFENYFGPYPYKRLAVTNIPYSHGQSWPTLIYLSTISFLDSTQRNALGITKHVELTDFFRAHESSHQWWGHRVGWKSYHDQWISEGFAQFSGNLYVQFRRNIKEYRNRLRQDKEELLKGRDRRNRAYESLGPVWMGRRLASGDSPRGYSTVIYNKGGYILHMLRMMLFDARSRDPEARFKAMMQDFCQTFHNQPASTEDFKAVVEKHMTQVMDLDGNGRMDWFFRQYVYGTGVPEYRFRHTVKDAGGGKWRVAGSVTQSGVPAGWKDVLLVYLHTGGRAVRLGGMRVAQKETSFDFTLPMKPEKLSLNYNEDLLAKIKQ